MSNSLEILKLITRNVPAWQRMLDNPDIIIAARFSQVSLRH